MIIPVLNGHAFKCRVMTLNVTYGICNRRGLGHYNKFFILLTGSITIWCRRIQTPQIIWK